MPDEVDPHAVLAQQIRLEGKHREHAIAAALKLAGPPLPPGPDLRRDEIEHGPPLPARGPREAQVESGVVDREEDPDLLFREQSLDAALKSKQKREPPHDFPAPHH